MNIFQVLSQGKSRLHEPSMSAMLGYLLDSNKDHGLGDTFVREFLTCIDNEKFRQILSFEFIDSQVSLEEPYQLNGQRKDIDIQIIIINEKKEEEYRIIIENKIKAGAANPKQLHEYYNSVLNEEPDIVNLAVIFLTPESQSSVLSSEFNKLVLQPKSGHSKIWVYWESPKDGVLNIVRSVLTKEMNGEINPVNEYMRHTLKAFIRHASSVTAQTERKKMRTGEDIGEIIDDAIIATKDGQKYRVIRRDSTQIQVFNEETGEKEIARRILAQYIDENTLGIPHEKLNTRGIGKQFFEQLKKVE